MRPFCALRARFVRSHYDRMRIARLLRHADAGVAGRQRIDGLELAGECIGAGGRDGRRSGCTWWFVCLVRAAARACDWRQLCVVGLVSRRRSCASTRASVLFCWCGDMNDDEVKCVVAGACVVVVAGVGDAVGRGPWGGVFCLCGFKRACDARRAQ